MATIELRWISQPWLVACIEDGDASPVYRMFSTQQLAEEFALNASDSTRKSHAVFHLKQISAAFPQRSKLGEAL